MVEGEPLDLEPGDSIMALDYLMEKEAIIIGTMNGYLLLHNVDDNTTEVVGRVEGGVKNIAPSPDGAVLAVTTGLGQILVMTHDWEVLYETTLDPAELDFVRIFMFYSWISFDIHINRTRDKLCLPFFFFTYIYILVHDFTHMNFWFFFVYACCSCCLPYYLQAFLVVSISWSMWFQERGYYAPS